MKVADGFSTDARAWRALGRFWAVVLAATALGAAVLAWLGPPVAPPEPPAVAAPGDAAQAPPGPHAEAAPRHAGEAEGSAPLGAATAETPGQAIPPGTVAAETPASLPAPAAAGHHPSGALVAPLPQLVTPVPPAATAPTIRAEAAPMPVALPPASTAAPGPIPPPDPGLTEASRHGPLPRIGPDGRSPARLYARGFDRAQPGPRVALLVGGIGMSQRLAEEAIARLPPDVSLALSPYAPNLAPLLAAARARGMETLMSLPFEPQGWPLNDPGDQAMLTGLPMEQNLDRLFWALSRAQGQIGAVGALGPLRGERFAAQPGALEAVQRILASRGLIYVEPRPGAPGPGFAWGVAVDLVVDEPGGAAAIDARLAALEARARERGSAVGYAGDPSPVLVARVAAWAEGLARRGVVLAPVSAMIRRPEPR